MVRTQSKQTVERSMSELMPDLLHRGGSECRSEKKKHDDKLTTLATKKRRTGRYQALIELGKTFRARQGDTINTTPSGRSWVV